MKNVTTVHMVEQPAKDHGDPLSRTEAMKKLNAFKIDRALQPSIEK